MSHEETKLPVHSMAFPFCLATIITMALQLGSVNSVNDCEYWLLMIFYATHIVKNKEKYNRYKFEYNTY